MKKTKRKRYIQYKMYGCITVLVIMMLGITLFMALAEYSIFTLVGLCYLVLAIRIGWRYGLQRIITGDNNQDDIHQSIRNKSWKQDYDATEKTLLRFIWNNPYGQKVARMQMEIGTFRGHVTSNDIAKDRSITRETIDRAWKRAWEETEGGTKETERESRVTIPRKGTQEYNDLCHNVGKKNRVKGK